MGSLRNTTLQAALGWGTLLLVSGAVLLLIVRQFLA